MTAERLSGFAFVLFALAMIFLVIPANTESESYGWTRPDTLPLITCWTIAALGCLQMVRPPRHSAAIPAGTLRFALVVALTVAAVALMDHLGFLAGTILLVLAAMLIGGERRWPLVAAGSLGIPIVIWVIVVYWLGRPLP